MKRIICIIVLLCVTFLLIAGYGEIVQISNEKKKESMIRNAQDCIEQYPDLPEPYVSSICYYFDEGRHLLLVNVNDSYIGGERSGDGNTIYYLCDDAAIEDNEIAVRSSEDVNRVTERIKSSLMDFVRDTNASYTYHKATGNVLPIWVSPLDDDYVKITRPGYEDYVEVISRSGIKYDRIICRWSIAKSDDDVKLYWIAVDYPISQSGYIRGWGYVPDEIIQALNVQNGT